MGAARCYAHPSNEHEPSSNPMTRILHPLVIAASLLLFAFTAHAEDKIEGAFGKRFGDVFDPVTAIGKHALTDDTVMYQFKPENPFRSFKKYYVLITPTTNRIYAIWGVGPIGNTEKGKKEQALVMKLLIQKYGVPNKEGLFDGFYDLKQISQGNRYVMTKLTDYTDTTIEIRYYDSDLEKVAEQERLAIEAKKADSKGL